MTEQRNFEIMDFIAIWSLDIGLQNLELNKLQVDGIMREMTEKQDSLLHKIIEQNEHIIKLLENMKNENN